MLEEHIDIGWEGDSTVEVGDDTNGVRNWRETPGKEKNLADYLRNNKRILITAAELQNDFDQYFARRGTAVQNRPALEPGLAEYNIGNADNLIFIDSQGNLAMIEVIDPDKIDEIIKIMTSTGKAFRTIIKELLENLGFNLGKISEDMRMFLVEERYKEKSRQEGRTEKSRRDKFDF